MVDKAEIVKIRKSTISHVSTSLKKLENKGLVEKIQSKDNKKHIEIILLDKAELIIEAGHNAQKQFAKNVNDRTQLAVIYWLQSIKNRKNRSVSIYLTRSVIMQKNIEKYQCN